MSVKYNNKTVCHRTLPVRKHHAVKKYRTHGGKDPHILDVGPGCRCESYFVLPLYPLGAPLGPGGSKDVMGSIIEPCSDSNFMYRLTVQPTCMCAVRLLQSGRTLSGWATATVAGTLPCGWATGVTHSLKPGLDGAWLVQ